MSRRYSVDLCAADYCPTCGQPRDRISRAVECGGLHLAGDGLLSFEGNSVRLTTGPAKILRAVMEKGKASHEYIILRASPDMESNVIQVQVCRLRKLLLKLTGGGVELRTIWGWGYELAAASVKAEAA